MCPEATYASHVPSEASRSKTAFPSWRTSPRCGGTGARPPRSSARFRVLTDRRVCAGQQASVSPQAWGIQRPCDGGRFYSCRGCHRGGSNRSSPRSLVRLAPRRPTKAPTSRVARGRIPGSSAAYKQKLSASWSCQVRAHRVEQNGSPFLTAKLGRLWRQFTQRPSPRWGGSAGSERRSPNLNRASSASFP